MALFAIEMDVLVVESVVVIALAGFVAQRTASVLDGMDGMVLQQEGERAEDGTAFGRRHTVFQVAQRQGTASTLQFLVYEQTHGGELDTMVLQVLLYFLFFQELLIN